MEEPDGQVEEKGRPTMIWSFFLFKPSHLHWEFTFRSLLQGSHKVISQMLLTSLGVLWHIFWAFTCMLVHVDLHCCSLFRQLWWSVQSTA